MRAAGLLAPLMPIAALALVALGGCGDDSAVWTEVSPERMSPAQAIQQRRATDARDRAAQRLLARLTEALDADGPARAIEVCREEAPRIVAEAAAQTGVRLGRTSYRLRNPANTPPPWAVSRVSVERRSEPVWLAGPDGVLAGLLPIPMGMPCVTCHGPAADLAEPVRRALARNYPEDQATDFPLGGLRGWFWVEAPPAP